MKKIISVSVAAVMFVSLLGGCGAKQTQPSAPSVQSSEAGMSQNGETEKTTVGETSAPKDITFAQSIAITSLDPAGMQPQGYPSGYEAAFAIHNGLIRFDEELNFIPDLAESWEPSADGLSWDFKLREGVTFHDGEPFNADAVVKQYTRMLDKTVNIGAYSLWEPIERVEKISDYEVKISTKQPYSAFLNVMAHGSALIPSPKAVEADPDNYGLSPVGTGPYKLVSMEPGTELKLARFDDYYEGTPEYDTVTFRYVADPSARIAALKSGDVDVIDAVPFEYAGELSSDSKINLISKPGLQVFGIGLNQNNRILQDKTVRQALNYAIDKEAIAKVLFMGYVTPLTGPLAPNTVGSVSLTPYHVDIDKANQMLEEAGWTLKGDVREKDGEQLKFSLIVPDGMYPKDVILSETIQNQLKKVGVQVSINKVEKSTYWDQLKVPSAKTGYDMALWGYNPSHGNGQIHMESLFTSNKSAEEKPELWNFIWYQNDEVDRLLMEAKEQVLPEEFNESMRQAEEIVWEECPYIWLYSNNIISAASVDVDHVIVLPVVFTLVHRMK
ncbi:MAG: ABC transporter substrate-binding protein [Hungatella hathewayi]|nr:ABC transporter substrate-binding protein [Hungatella hathewayi]